MLFPLAGSPTWIEVGNHGNQDMLSHSPQTGLWPFHLVAMLTPTPSSEGKCDFFTNISLLYPDAPYTVIMLKEELSLSIV